MLLLDGITSLSQIFPQPCVGFTQQFSGTSHKLGWIISYVGVSYVFKGHYFLTTSMDSKNLSLYLSYRAQCTNHWHTLLPTSYGTRHLHCTYQNIQGTSQFLGDYLKISGSMLQHILVGNIQHNVTFPLVDISYLTYVGKQSDSC